ncbi:hypothetical protein [Haloferax sp. DFSO52]|uniref:DUF7344 domain-containing protein n=1 Tax=Haloferax sp. DFSO52 TaxID=3388505 RepID=UPI003A84C224
MECHRRAYCFGVFRTPGITRSDAVGSMTMAVSATPRLDEAFDALRNVHRRRLLLNLRHGSVTRLGGATRVVADGGTNDHEQLEVELFHLHLPKLDSAGYVSWHRESGVIEKGPAFEDIVPLLELLENNAEELPETFA